jgi:hypothetical protein
VTCFFIDTGHQRLRLPGYDNIDRNRRSLDQRYQRHGNAIISMTATDLRSVLESDACGQECWEILSGVWIPCPCCC